MIVKSDYQYGGAGALIKYIAYNKGEKVEIRDHTGREVSQEELDEFVERSKEMGMERQIIIAPDPDAGIGTEDLDRSTRRLMSEWRSGRPSTEYMYAVHDAEPAHVHVAVTGDRRDLYMDTEDLTELREKAADQMREQERIQQREDLQEAERDLERAIEQELQRDREPERSRF